MNPLVNSARSLKTRQEELIRWIGRLQDLQRCLPSLIDLVDHARAQVEEQPDRHRRVFLRKGQDLLFDLVLEQLKVVFVQPENQPILEVRHRHVNQHHLHIDLNWLDQRLGMAWSDPSPVPASQRSREASALIDAAVVSVAVIYVNRRLAGACVDFYFEVSPRAVVMADGFVSQHVLVAQLHVDFGGDLG